MPFPPDVSDTQELEADKGEEKPAGETAEKTIIEERLLKLAVDVSTRHWKLISIPQKKECEVLMRNTLSR